MDGVRVAKTFLRRTAIYAEQHRVDHTAVGTASAPEEGSWGRQISDRALQTIKLQVPGRPLVEPVFHSLSRVQVKYAKLIFRQFAL